MMSTSSSQQPASKKVLIADDDPGVLRFLAERCRRLGYEVQTAANGLHAVVIAGRFRPDVVILDINMPEIDGLSVAAELLAPGRQAVEVIVITASSFAETRRRCLSFGAIHVRKGAGLMEDVEAALAACFPAGGGRPAEPGALSAEAGNWTLPRLLIVDDDPDTGELLSSRLLKCGIETIVASNGIQGHRSACRHEPSLVMTKHAMPNGDAEYLLQKLRSTPKTERVPVIVFGRNEVDDADQARLKRLDVGDGRLLTFLPGPIVIEELFAQIQKTCAFSVEPSAFHPGSSAAASLRR